MTPSTAELSQVAQILASRDAELSAMNDERMAAWVRRYPHDVVMVPQSAQPPDWPVRHHDAVPPLAATVTKLKARAR